MRHCTCHSTYSKAIGVASLWKLPGKKNAGLSGQIDRKIPRHIWEVKKQTGRESLVMKRFIKIAASSAFLDL